MSSRSRAGFAKNSANTLEIQRREGGDYAMSIFDDALYRQQWALKKINLELAQQQLQAKGGGKPVTVAIVDWGVQANHREFRDGPAIEAARVIPPADGKTADDNTVGHGTMLAGIIGGLVPGVRLLVVKFIDARTTPNAEKAAAAIRFAITHPSAPRVINASWDVSLDQRSVLAGAIEEARSRQPGVVVVAGAGNDGRDNDQTRSLPATFAKPDAEAVEFSNLISVMASDENDNKPEFSNYGKRTVHLAAPGTRIISTTTYRGANPPEAPGAPYSRGYFLYDGTSTAAALVSAAAAMLLSADDKLSPKQVRDRLIKSADKSAGLQGLCQADGRLNLSQALVSLYRI
jgi:thermitase